MEEMQGHCDALDNQPVVEEDLLEVWRIWWKLSNARSTGFSEADPLEAQNVVAELSLHMVWDPLTRLEYSNFFRQLDHRYCELAKNKPVKKEVGKKK